MYNAWVRSGSSGLADSDYSFYSSGSYDYGSSADVRYAVRPASSNAVN